MLSTTVTSASPRSSSMVNAPTSISQGFSLSSPGSPEVDAHYSTIEDWGQPRPPLSGAIAHASCPQKRSAVRASVLTAVSNSPTATYSSGRWEMRTSPGPKSTVGV